MRRLDDSQPVLVKELRGRMRGARAFVVLTIFLLVLSGFALLLYLVVRSSVQNDPFSAGRTIGKTLFFGIGIVALIQVMIIVPAQAAGAISGEREAETYDLLVATLLPAWKIVLGKLLASLAYAVLLIIAVVPFMALAFFFGGVAGSEVAIALVGLMVTALLYGAVGILCSSIAARTMTATVMTQAANVLVILGIPFLLYVFFTMLRWSGPGEWPAWTENYIFIYLAGSVLAVHPFIALGAAAGLFSTGETGPFVRVDWGQGEQFWIPHPWIAFTVEGLVLAALLIMLAIRAVRPQDTNPSRRRGRSRQNSR